MAEKGSGASRYERIIEHVFHRNYQTGASEVRFERGHIEDAAQELSIALPKNLGDVVYSFRYRSALPESVAEKAPMGRTWIITGAGIGLYRFVAVAASDVAPQPMLAEIKVPDATPGLISRYALSDEQALLAKLRYNRLIDIFTGVTCYSLQNHLRTTVPGVGQVETDEIYIGLDCRGAHFVLPVQAKGGRDKLSVVQIMQDLDLCAAKFPNLLCRPIAAQFMRDDVIALFAFQDSSGPPEMTNERHYRLVRPDELSAEDLMAYRSSLPAR